MVITLNPPRRTLTDVLVASVALVRGTSKPATVIRIPDPARLRAARQAIAERARHVGANAALREQANACAIRELATGRSTAVAVAIACSTFTGRTNRLLPPIGPVPA